jgi:hypothetical protein
MVVYASAVGARTSVAFTWDEYVYVGTLWCMYVQDEAL